jgi:hypothetical protein
VLIDVSRYPGDVEVPSFLVFLAQRNGALPNGGGRLRGAEEIARGLCGLMPPFLPRCFGLRCLFSYRISHRKPKIRLTR